MSAATTAPREPAFVYIGGYRIQIAPIACPYCSRIVAAQDPNTDRPYDVDLTCQGCHKILLRAEWVGEL